LLAWTKIRTRENCFAPVGGPIREIFAAENTALLTQSKDDKVKSAE
jgi:hypothetical protein